MTDNPNHLPDGTFAPGNTCATPLKGRTTWRKRVEQLDEKYNSVEKLMALFVRDAATGKMSPGPELLEMHPRDAGILIQALGAVFGDDKRAERESYWDREEGKPRQRLAHGGDPDNPSPIQWDGTFTLKFSDANGDSAK